MMMRLLFYKCFISDGLSMLFSALLGAGTSAYSSTKSIEGQKDVNRMNYQMAREQMDFQKYMFENRHQMEVADLRKAGLNPILSATGGQAPVPSGSTAVAVNPYKDMPEIGLSTAKLIGDMVQGFKKLATEGLTQQNIQSQTDINKEQKKIAKNNVLISQAQVDEARAKALEAQASSAQAQNDLRVEQEYKDTLPYIRKWGRDAKPWLDFGGDVFRMFNRGWHNFDIRRKGKTSGPIIRGPEQGSRWDSWDPSQY